jgi:hypothetical protein
MIPEFGTPLEIARAIYLEALQQFRARDSDGTATAAINEDLSSKGRPMTNTPAPLYLVVLKQELTQDLQRLDALDRERAKLWERIDKGRKDLAKVRGSIFLRIETLRQELLG